MSFSSGSEFLFTRQRHDAKRAGLHYDIRFVVGDKAYSWATKKEIPEVGKSILLYEQPVHDSDYALSKRVEIPDGQYGAGITTLDYVRKARVGENATPEQFTFTSRGEKYLIKKLDPKYGDKAWLFKRLEMPNKYLEKAAMLIAQYQCPDTKKTIWVPENKPAPHGYIKTGVKTYKKRQS